MVIFGENLLCIKAGVMLMKKRRDERRRERSGRIGRKEKDIG